MNDIFSVGMKTMPTLRRICSVGWARLFCPRDSLVLRDQVFEGPQRGVGAGAGGDYDLFVV